MDLGTVLDELMHDHAVRIGADQDRIVAFRLPDGIAVGLRLHHVGPRRWDVREIRVRRGDGSLHGHQLHDLPLASMVAEARRLATRSLQAAASPATDESMTGLGLA